MTTDPTEYNKVKRAEREIAQTYNHTVSVLDKNKQLRKFGQNLLVGTTKAVIMTLNGSEVAETLPTTNAVTVMSSTSGSDTQNLTLLEGHTIDGSDDLTFVANTTATALTGQTDANLPVALNRITRARLDSPAVGTIYFHEGGATTSGEPDDDTTIHMIIPAGEIQSQKCSTAISSTDYWIITGVTASVLEKAASWAQFRVEIKLNTAADDEFYPLTQWFGVSDGSGTVELIGAEDPCLIVPPNHDVRLVAIADGASTSCAGGITGYLAAVQS